MGRKFTPIVGLAVVVALALAAVFGSMSLANPAQAQDDTPEIENLMQVVHEGVDTDGAVKIEWDALSGHEAPQLPMRSAGQKSGTPIPHGPLALAPSPSPPPSARGSIQPLLLA